MGELRIEQTRTAAQQQKQQYLKFNPEQAGIKIFNGKNLNTISKGLDFIGD